MGALIVAQAGPTAGRARCTCGHFPTQHMTVLPDAPGKPGGFHMAPAGSCSVCGTSVCPKYARGG